jgi:FkbM family methyltransferase
LPKVTRWSVKSRAWYRLVTYSKLTVIMIKLIRTLRYILAHPLNNSARWAALKRYVRWQISSRLALGPTVVPFVNDTRLVVTAGMTGATGNIYAGLQEYSDCALLLHLLRPSDLFIDVGANIGVYTVLASGVVGARTVSIEPIPPTYAELLVNIRLNDIADRVRSYNIGLGSTNDTLRFTPDLGTCNHVVTDSDLAGPTIGVPVRPLDDVVGDEVPTLIKVDVEGWESEVLAGAQATLRHQSLLGLIVEMNSNEKHLTLNEQTVHDCLTRHSFYPYTYAPSARRLVAAAPKSLGASNTIYLRNIETVKERIAGALPFRVNGREV